MQALVSGIGIEGQREGTHAYVKPTTFVMLNTRARMTMATYLWEQIIRDLGMGWGRRRTLGGILVVRLLEGRSRGLGMCIVQSASWLACVLVRGLLTYPKHPKN